jgi:hypothetical protein
MIGTVSREETNLRSQPVQNAPQGKYEYNPNVPSFDARISREQDMYSLFASSSAVSHRSLDLCRTTYLGRRHCGKG